KEFREALTLLASGSDDQRRQVGIHFSGTGRRQVRVGYVTEAPLWKMSYRLMIGGKDAKAGAPYLQGWALVENTSDDDWKDVRLSLVSGRPVSFIQDLYQPLYLPRPVIAPDVIASAMPQTHGGNMDEERKQVAAQLNIIYNNNLEKAPIAERAQSSVQFESVSGAFVDKDGRLGRGGAGGRSNLGIRRVPALGELPLIGNMFTDNAEIVRQSVQSQSTGANAGEL